MRIINNRLPLFAISILLGSLLVFSACQKDKVEKVNEKPILTIPDGFPDVLFPADNAFSQKRWELGKRLFYDPILSRDSTLSCGSCHKQSLAFADDVAFSPGIDNRPGTTNAPTLANVAYHPYFLREGGVPTLEMQILVPIQEHNEFDHNIVLIAQKLAQKSDYIKLSQEAYNRVPDAFVITRAIATFERSLLSGNSLFDQWQNGDASALSASALRGKNLFFSPKTNCGECHGGFNFTDYSFQNNGLDTAYQSLGRMRLTNNESDRAKFKVPSLRNVALTAPYMHDGRFASLQEVVAHYNSGGFAHKNKSTLIKPLQLTESEMNDLISFLNSLSDFEFINDARFGE